MRFTRGHLCNLTASMAVVMSGLLYLVPWVCGQTSRTTAASGDVIFSDIIAPEPNDFTTSTAAVPVFRNPIFDFVDGTGPEEIKVADVDGNGCPDIITAVQNYNGRGLVSVTLDRCHTQENVPHSYDSGGYRASSVAVADLNGDGKLDIAVANYGCPPPGGCSASTGVVAVLLGNGDGTFETAVPYHINDSQAASIAVADLNGDGKYDLIVGALGGVTVLLGNGDGTFQPPIGQSAGTTVMSIAVADLNGDGKLDVVAASQSSGIGVLIGKGDGTFNAPIFYQSGVSTGGWPNAVTVADLNDDGNPDLAVANYPDNTVGILLNLGNGTFSPAVTYDVGATNAVSVAVADMNADLKRDLIVVDQGKTVSMLLGNGDGTFQAPLVYSLFGPAYNSIAIVDFNGDRTPDLVLNDGTGEVQVLRNITSPSVATTTTLTSSADPSVAGTSITLTAAVSSPLGSPPSAEAIIFRDGSKVLAIMPLVKGSAELSVSSLPVGKHNLSAHYPGDSDFLRPSTSLYLRQVVTAP